MDRAERLIRNLVTAFDTTGTITDVVHRLTGAMVPARWYIEDIDACKYVDDNGISCTCQAVRTVLGIPCCEFHAAIRENF